MILKFNVSGRFAFFKDKITTRNNSSYKSIHRPNILGILGSILGKSGFSDFKELGYIEYLRDLNEIKVGIKINSEIKFMEVITNDSTSLGITARPGVVLQNTERLLENPNFDIYLDIQDKELYNEIKETLIKRNYIFNPVLGKSYLAATITNVEELTQQEEFNIKMDSENNSYYVKSLFPVVYLDEEIKDYDLDEFDEIGTKMILPVSSNSSGMYNDYLELTYNNYMDKSYLEYNDNLKVVDNEIIFFM
jgi:CRISPR-associated protein Cas5h